MTSNLEPAQEFEILQSIFRHAPAGILLVDETTGALLRANPGACRYFGVKEDAIDQIDPSAYADLLSLPHDGTDELLEVTHLRDGSGPEHARYLRAKRTHLDLENANLSVVIFHDATEHHRFAEEATRSKDFLKAIISSSPLPIYTIDCEGIVCSWNEAAARVFGFSADEARGKLVPIVAENQQADFKNNIKMVLDGSGLNGKEVQRFRKNGEPVWISLFTAPIRDAAGEVTHILVINEDITRRRVREAELAAAREQAEQASKAKTSFLAMINHELRTPLNPVIGMTDLLLETSKDEEIRSGLEIIQRGGEAMSRLISDLLEVVKIDSGETLSETEWEDPDLLARDIRETRSEEAQERGLAFHVLNRLPRASEIQIDIPTLQRAISYLVDNALKFTRSGSVVVSLAFKPGGEADADESPYTHGAFEVVVEDTGCGIPENLITTIFDPFMQADPSTTRHYEGTGLGLTIAQKLCRLMGGDIRVQSRQGRGSRFTIVVPALLKESTVEVFPRQEAESTLVPGDNDVAIAGQEAEANPRRVLIVEDSKANRDILSRVLQHLGYGCEMAEDGETALRILEKRPSDFPVVLLDIRLPNMDGFEVAGHIRQKLPEDRQPHVIAVTAHALPSDKQRCFEAGMDGYLAKPFRMEELSEMLSRFVEKRWRKAI